MPVFRVDTEFNIPHIEKSEYAEKEDFMGNIELKNNNEKDKKEEVPIEK